jgi:hypothetical protein
VAAKSTGDRVREKLKEREVKLRIILKMMLNNFDMMA